MYKTDSSTGFSVADFDNWWENSSAYARHETTTDQYSQLAKQQVLNFSRLVSPEPNQRCLDLGCGPGFHATALAEIGLIVTGLDLDETSFNKTRNSGNLKFLAQDMREQFGSEEYDFITSFNTSIGYFRKDDDNRRVFENIARALVPEGRFLCDLLNRDYLLKHFDSSESFVDKNGVRTDVVRKLDPTERFVLATARTTASSGRVTRWRHRVRLFSHDDLVDQARSAGLLANTVWGNWNGEIWDKDLSTRMIVEFLRK